MSAASSGDASGRLLYTIKVSVMTVGIWNR
jgi:hypothetical protein